MNKTSIGWKPVLKHQNGLTTLMRQSATSAVIRSIRSSTGFHGVNGFGPDPVPRPWFGPSPGPETLHVINWNPEPLMECGYRLCSLPSCSRTSPGLEIIEHHSNIFDHVVPVGPLRGVVSKKDRPRASLNYRADGLAGPLAERRSQSNLMQKMVC